MISSFLAPSRLTFRFIGTFLWLSATLWSAPARAQVSVLTQHNDNARTGANLSETTLNTSNVNASGFGKLFSRPVDSLIWTQPLYLPGVSVPGAGTRNVVYVGTENATLYAFDADKAAAPLWTTNLAPAPYSSGYRGIVGTPVIDAATQTLYVVANIRQPDGNFIYRLNALDVATGAHKAGSPVPIQGSVPGTGVGSSGGLQTFNPAWERQRPGLLLVNGTVYVGFGSINTEEPGDIYYGWMFAFNAATLARSGIWCGAPDGLGATLWNSGQGPASDGSSIYVMTGNGRFSASSGGRDYGDSFVRFDGAGGALGVADYFTPFDESYMDRADFDLGSAGPMLLPDTNLIVSAGKKGTIYVVNRAAMGGHRLDNDSQIVQSFPAFNGHFHGSPVTWTTPSNGRVIYGWSEEDQLKVFKFANGLFQTSPIQRSTMSVPPGMPGGFLSLSANGAAPGTGILWALHPFDGDANPGIVNGILRAFDANDVTKELWNSRQNAARDDFGKYAKFNYVTVANGKVYVPTFSSQLVVYGLLAAPTKPVAPIGLAASAGDAKIALSWNASANASSYTLKRAVAAGGPFAVVAANSTALSYVDAPLANNTTYYYVVLASNATGQSLNSNVVSATPKAAPSPLAPQGISLDFVGGGTNGQPGTMAASEIAGVVRLPNWNALSGGAGKRGALTDSRGAATAATVNWASAGPYSTRISPTVGDARMMKGYLNTSATSASTVTVAALPPAYLAAGYDVYLYFDGFNTTEKRAATYRLSALGSAAPVALTVTGIDAANANFTGTFAEANNSAGNYVRFNNLSASGFILSATPGAASDSSPRAAINGLQIVPHLAPLPSPTVTIAAPLAGAAVNALAEIKGTAADKSGAGLGQVELLLWRLQGDGVSKLFWNGTTWSATSTPLTTIYAPSAGTWTRNTALPAGATLQQGTYYVQARAVDASGRATTAQSSFVVDSVVPVVTVTTPADDATQSNLLSVAGTALDAGGSGVVRVDVVLVRVSDGKFWSYTSWVDFETGIDAALNGSAWNCTQNLPSSLDLSAGQYLVKGIAYDRAGNVGGGQSMISISAATSAAKRLAPSAVTVSSSIARADEDNVQLYFAGVLNAASAGNITHYTATVNGRIVKIVGAHLNPDNNSVLLVLPEGAIAPGDKVSVKWQDLRDFYGATIGDENVLLPAL